MIKAGSLFYALIVSLLVALISSSLILYAYLTSIQFNNIEMSNRLKLNVDSGLNLLLSDQTIVSPNNEAEIDLFGFETDSVYLKRRFWGAFEIIISQARFKRLNERKVALVGYVPDTSNGYCLYLKEDDKPLSVCGETRIKGDAYLPKAGIRRVQIEGQTFSGEKVLDGIIKKSERKLPKINQSLKDHLSGYLIGKHSTVFDSVINVGASLSGDSIFNSFFNKTVVFNSNEAIRVSNGSYYGNIIIFSKRQVIISNSAHLENCLVISPKIIFEENVKGCVQAFASDSVVFKGDVKLEYPSCIGLIQLQNSQKAPGISIFQKDTIIGCVFGIKNIASPNDPIGILISKNAIVCGTVLSEGYIDLKGSILGSLVTDRIMLNTSSSIYENHLLNAEIDYSKRSRHFVGIDIFEDSKQKEIVKWIKN